MILLRWLYIGENSRVSVRVGWLQYFSTTRTWTRCQDSARDSAPPILEDDSRDLCQVNVGRQAENPGGPCLKQFVCCCSLERSELARTALSTSKAKLQGQLSDSGIDGSAADHAECW